MPFLAHMSLSRCSFQENLRADSLAQLSAAKRRWLQYVVIASVLKEHLAKIGLGSVTVIMYGVQHMYRAVQHGVQLKSVQVT